MPPARPSQPGPLWLVGMMGAGKSSVGRLLAARLSRRFVDLDEAVERDAGRPVHEIFAHDGEAAFRAREAHVLSALAGASDDAVIATGGGAPCFEGGMDAMLRSGVVVWLRADVDEVLSRLDRTKRPLLQQGDPRHLWLALEAERRAVYARATLTVERGARDSQAVADEIAAWLKDYGDAPLSVPEVPAVWVELSAERRYPVFLDGAPGAEARFAAHLARRAPPGRTPLGLVTDENVARLHLPRFRAALHKRGFQVVEAVVPAGEASKSMAQAERLADAFASGGLDRRGAVVALGGGVVGDLAGFVASVLFRGVGLVQAPTTLLAMVDSSVGGKTGVNLRSGKNLAGTFHQPLLVYADLSTLATLDAREVSAGLAEVAKHALLDGGELWRRLQAEAERARAREPEVLAALIAASCRLKAKVVAGDERELRSDGGRALLNLGHTVGHALETHSHLRPRPGEGPLRHGEAVALGLLASARVAAASASSSEKAAVSPAQPDLESRLASLLARLGLPTDLDARLAEPGALAATAVDKKRAGDVLRYVALYAPGDARLLPLPPARLAAMLQRNIVPRPGTAPEVVP